MTDLPTVTIYTDGGSQPNPGPGGWAAVLVAENGYHENSAAPSLTTNNRMELTAAIKRCARSRGEPRHAFHRLGIPAQWHHVLAAGLGRAR